MKLIKTEEAVGHVLCHDMTQIIKGVTKDARFRKGHIVTEEDIPVLLSMGKENLYVWEKNENMLHEDEAAEILREICQGEHMHASQPKEGKIELTSDIDGILTINVEKLLAVNSLEQMMIATRHSYTPVKKGAKLAATRIIPLIIEKEKASIGMLQRMFKIGFNRAARIMDQLAQAGVVGPEEGTKPRKVLMTKEEFENYLQKGN